MPDQETPKEGLDQVVISFRLVGDEAKALRAWSTRELRKPTDQVRYLVRRELSLQRSQVPDDDEAFMLAQMLP